MKRLLPFTLATLLVAPPASADSVGKILATIDGAPVTTWEVKQFMVERSRGAEIPPDVRPDSPQVLDAFITEKLIQKEISDQGIVVTDADVDRYVEGIRVQNKLTLERLKAAVEAQGMTWDGYRAQVREEMQKAQLINKEIRGKVNVTPEEIRRYYEAHKSEFAPQGTQVHVRHLALPLPRAASDDEVDASVAKAKALRDQIDDVDDFAKVAKDETGDEEGGDLGYLDPNSMQEDLGDAVKKLEPGEVSEPIVSGGAVHLVMVEEIKEGSDEPVDQYSEEIKQKLYNEAIESRYERWLKEDLRLRHYVDIRP